LNATRKQPAPRRSTSSAHNRNVQGVAAHGVEDSAATETHLQWWRRRTTVNPIPQREQSAASASGTHGPSSVECFFALPDAPEGDVADAACARDRRARHRH
jgi:hypothetical protein